MKRVALYARYSTDLQRDASIDDQLRDCRAYAARQGWSVVGEYADHALTGEVWLRSDLQRLLRDGQTHQFDIVLAEGLDRLTRDQEDVARLFKQLTFVDVRIVTLIEGEITAMHIGFKGTMNALFLKDLADKTRRGLRGRVEAGKSGGGLTYGYRVIRGPSGEARGEFEIVPSERAIVVDIFREYVSGLSPQAIAQRLNRRGVRGPRGGSWSPSTIYGNWRRGTGILNNALYVGRMVWNRQRYLKDPTTRKRVSRLNPPEQWMHVAVPHLRMLDEEVWETAQARLLKNRCTTPTITHTRRPPYLFSGLTKCSVCGGGYNVQCRGVLRCFNRTVRGTCTNDRSITRQEIEGRILTAMQKFLPTDAFDRFCKVYIERVNEARREQRLRAAAIPREIADCERKQMEILEYLIKGVGVDRFTIEVQALEVRIKALKAQLATAADEPPIPALHARMADDFHQRTTALVAALDHGDELQRERVRETLRGFIDQIVIPPGDEALQLVGNLGELLTAATGWDGTTLAAVVTVGCGGAQPTVTTELHCMAA